MFGAAFDNPDLIVCCVVGDGEAETGPLATSWHCNRFIDPARDGAVLPILHLNGYKIANPTILARIPAEELTALFRGYGLDLADLRGYQYGREDVKARDLANAYSQALSAIFTQQMKPYEIELLVGEVDGDASGSSIYHVLFDGSVSDEQGYVAMGGHAEDLSDDMLITLIDRYLMFYIRTAGRLERTG